MFYAKVWDSNKNEDEDDWDTDTDFVVRFHIFHSLYIETTLFTFIF